MNNCTVFSPGSEAGTIKTTSLKSTLIWLKEAGIAAGDLIVPTSGTKLLEFELAGIGCAAATEGAPITITGAVIDEVLPMEAEVKTGSLALPGTPILSYWSNETPPRGKQTIAQMKASGSNSTLTGTFSDSLTSGETMGVAGASPPPPPPPSSPLAPRWKTSTGGVPQFLEFNQARAFTATNTSAVTIGTPGATIKMAECTENGYITGSIAKQPGGKTFTLTCKGVKSEQPGCTIHSVGQPGGTIVTSSLRSTLARTSGVVSGGSIGEVVESPNGGQWFTLVAEGVSCTLPESMAVSGKLIGGVTPIEEQVTTGTTLFPGTPILHYWDNGVSPVCEAKYMNESTGLCERTISQMTWGTWSFSFIGAFNFSPVTAGEKFGVSLG